MILVLKDNASQAQIDNLIKWLKSLGVDTHLSVGRYQTILGLVGDTSGLDEDLLSSLDFVETVKRIQEPFKNANRKFHPDDTVVDMVAHTRLKTPTAVAEFLISRMDVAMGELDGLRQDIISLVSDTLSRQKTYIRLLVARFPALARGHVERCRSTLRTMSGRLPAMASALLSRKRSLVENLELRLRNGVNVRLSENARQVQLTEQFIKMASPDYILRRGYSLTLKKGKISMNIMWK